MENLILIKPDISHKDQIESFKKEMLDSNSSIDGAGGLYRMDTKHWLKVNKDCENRQTVIDGWVECEQFVYLRKEDLKIVGMIQFRHYFNEFLEKYGGHIGYSVVPSERLKGYAKNMLSECKKVCKSYGLEKILITCEINNIASKKVILANNGVYESTVYFEKEDIYLERYWIDL